MKATSLVPVRVQRLPTNRSGRDFVIGDLHGHRATLDRLLARVEFDGERDRLFSTGDLIDRGPDNLECLALLREPWFYAVRGNHEVNLSSMLFVATLSEPRFPSELKATLLQNLAKGMGAQWVLDVDQHGLQWQVLSSFKADIDALPHVLVVEEDDRGLGRFQVVHAELLSAGIRSDAALDALGEHLTMAQENTLYWSRKTFLAANRAGVSKKSRLALSTTFCGHNATAEPLRWKNHWFIDTGCGFPAGRLTLVEVANATCFTEAA